MKEDGLNLNQVDEGFHLLGRVLLELRLLLREGRHLQALDLVEAAHNLPSALTSGGWREVALSDLRFYAEKYGDAGPGRRSSMRYDQAFEDILAGRKRTAAPETGGPGPDSPGSAPGVRHEDDPGENRSVTMPEGPVPARTRVSAPAPGDPEEAWVRLRHPRGAVALVAPPPAEEPEGRRLYFELAAGAEIEEIDALIAPFLALEFADRAAATTFAHAAVHNAVSVYEDGVLHGEYAGGEEA